MTNDDGLKLWDRMHKEGKALYWNLRLRGGQSRYDGPYVLRTLPPMDDFVFVSVSATSERVTIVPYELVESFQLGPDRDLAQQWIPPSSGG